MPCVEGELCHVPATSPKSTKAHGCQGGYGGRLHGTCGSIADDNEMHRIYLQSLPSQRREAQSGSAAEAQSDSTTEGCWGGKI